MLDHRRVDVPHEDPGGASVLHWHVHNDVVGDVKLCIPARRVCVCAGCEIAEHQCPGGHVFEQAARPRHALRPAGSSCCIRTEVLKRAVLETDVFPGQNLDVAGRDRVDVTTPAARLHFLADGTHGAGRALRLDKALAFHRAEPRGVLEDHVLPCVARGPVHQHDRLLRRNHSFCGQRSHVLVEVREVEELPARKVVVKVSAGLEVLADVFDRDWWGAANRMPRCVDEVPHARLLHHHVNSGDALAVQRVVAVRLPIVRATCTRVAIAATVCTQEHVCTQTNASCLTSCSTEAASKVTIIGRAVHRAFCIPLCSPHCCCRCRCRWRLGRKCCGAGGSSLSDVSYDDCINGASHLRPVGHARAAVPES